MTSIDHDQQLGTQARSFLDERQQWRERTLQGLVVSTFVASCFAATWFTAVPYGVPRLMHVVNLAAVLLGALALVRRRLPFAVRAVTFLAIIYTTALLSTLFIGFNPNALVGYATMAVAAALLFGLMAAIVTVGAASLAILGTSLAHSMGLVRSASNWADVLDSSWIANGVRVTGIFALLSMSCVVGISYLLKRSEELVLQQARAFQALRDDQLVKERLHRDLEQQETALRKARELETLGRLAGSMAHDFNNALLVMWAALDDLSEHGDRPSARAAAVAALRTATDQAASTTRNLRAFGPPSPRRPTVLQLTSVISRAKASLERVLPPNIVIDSEIQVEATVAADEGELLRVLTNLALNARDAMRDGGRLLLRVRPVRPAERAAAADTDRIALEVTDTGSGMAEDVKLRLFEPFFTTKELGGTGLGLATVREVVQAYGGDVAVASELGRGTTITLLWPTASGATEPASSRSPPPSGRGRVVLLVDDDPAVLAALAKSLTGAGFRVVEASSAASALETLRRGSSSIQVLCTDWMMPGRPVRDVIDEFRRLHGGAVLVCSGYAAGETGISDVVDDFLTKPFLGEELIRRIHRLLGEAADAPAAVPVGGDVPGV